MSGESVLDLDGVTKVYGEEPPVPALRGVSFSVRRGKLVAIVTHVTLQLLSCTHSHTPHGQRRQHTQPVERLRHHLRSFIYARCRRLSLICTRNHPRLRCLH